MLITRRVAALALVAAFLACARTETAAKKGRDLPSGDGVWFEDGLAPSEAEVEKELVQAGFASVFLPAVRLARSAGRWSGAKRPPPPKPFERTAVFLVVGGGPDVAQAVGTADSEAAETFAGIVSTAIQDCLKTRVSYGANVSGAHLDFPFAPGSAAAYGGFLKVLRRMLPRELLLTVSLRFTPGEGERKRLGAQLAAADGFVAFVFGEAAIASPVGADELGKPWWAAYCPGARGVWKDASGQTRGALGEKDLLRLSNDSRFDLANDLTFKEEAASSLLLSPRQPVRTAGAAFGVGDRLAFRQPALSEMLYRFGADLAGRRRVRGRIVVLSGASEEERIFTLAALSDLIMGRSLDPDLRVSVSGARSTAISVSAYNASSHSSVISRISNWVDVDLPGGRIRDVQPGGFDRYGLYDTQGHTVTPGRATRVRFFETLIGPSERIEPARILLNKPAPADCCRYRQSVVSSAGSEVKTAWIVPTPAPTPVARAKAPQRKHSSR
jgi:hypothetical protein